MVNICVFINVVRKKQWQREKRGARLVGEEGRIVWIEHQSEGKGKAKEMK